MADPIILALSGKKQSGKGTAFRFIKSLNDWMDIPCEEFIFAYKLKEFCRDVLGLTHEQAFGTDAHKNTLVPHLLWENFPVPAWEWPKTWWSDKSVEVATQQPYKIVYKGGHYGPPIDIRATPKTGPMTGREVLQYWGSEITRKLYPNVWADACIRQIRSSETYKKGGVCIITDVRFPNEVEAVEAAGGKVGRLTRDAFNDTHASEVSLDRDRFDWGRFAFVVDNSTLDVRNTWEALFPHLLRLGVVKDVSTKGLYLTSNQMVDAA